MNLIIKKTIFQDQDPLINYSFLYQCLIPELYMYITSRIDKRYTQLWDKYFKEFYNTNTQDIIIQGALNLYIKDTRDFYIIQIKDNQTVQGTTAKLYDLCNEINYGSLSLPPYPIFDNAFRWAEKNIEPLYLQWVEDMSGGD